MMESQKIIYLSARKDLQVMGIRHDLWPDENETYPLAIYQLTNQGKKSFLFLIGYSEGNSITRDLVDGGFGGMKRPGDVTSKREEVLEGDWKGVFEIGKNKVKEWSGWVWEVIEEETLNRWES